MARLNSACRWAGVALLVAAGGLAGCATAPAPLARTTVVLLPDEDGNVGAVSLTTVHGSKQIDEAFGLASTTEAGWTAPRATASGREAVDANYADLLNAQPPRPKTFVLHFLLDKTVLTDASKALLPEVLQAARERKPTEITIFGHADSSGTKEYNLKLSAERANAVAEWLRKSDPALGRLEVQYFGDAEPAVRSGQRVEPRNRRAEIMIL